jgi:hypothetical protein
MIELKNKNGAVEKREAKINIESNSPVEEAKNQLLEIAKQESKELY